MKKTTYITTRFDTDNNFCGDKFYVEVSKNGESVEFVLCLENYGYKSFMFGMNEKDYTEDMWEEIIVNNIEDYIDMFIDDITSLNVV